MEVEGFELKDAVVADGERVKMQVEGVVRDGRIEPDVVQVVEPYANAGALGYSDDELKGTARDGG
jgi:hypothetical protein